LAVVGIVQNLAVVEFDRADGTACARQPAFTRGAIRVEA